MRPSILPLISLIWLISLLPLAATAADDTATYPLRLPTPHGEVILPDAQARKAHDDWRYATVRRVGDTLYVSGVIVYRGKDEGIDIAAFKTQVRRALQRLEKNLAAADSDFQHVAMINTFHVFQSPHFNGTRHEHFQAFEDVIGEFMKPPYPAWTAVGTTGLLADDSIVEIQLIATVK